MRAAFLDWQRRDHSGGGVRQGPKTRRAWADRPARSQHYLTLLRFCVRRRGGDGRGRGGLLRGGGLAVGGFVRAAAGYGQEGGGRDAGENDFLHNYICGLVSSVTGRSLRHRSLHGYKVKPDHYN